MIQQGRIIDEMMGRLPSDYSKVPPAIQQDLRAGRYQYEFGQIANARHTILTNQEQLRGARIALNVYLEGTKKVVDGEEWRKKYHALIERRNDLLLKKLAGVN